MPTKKKEEKIEVKPMPIVEPTRSRASAETTGGVVPAPVSRVYSSRGLEYLFMVLSLVVLTIGVALLSSDIVGYLFDTSGTADGPADWLGVEAMTAVGAVFFFYLWSRLRAAEHVTPSLLVDASRKRALQRGLIVGFVALVVLSVAFVYSLFDILSQASQTEKSHWEALVKSFVLLGIVGLAFALLFNEERKGN